MNEICDLPPGYTLRAAAYLVAHTAHNLFWR
jgi:hypothetical protein